MLNKHKLDQIKYYNNFKYNVSFEIFQRVKGYHAKNILDLIKKRPEEGSLILYVACGLGYHIKFLGRGVGTDISFNCVKNVVKLGFPGVVCDVEDLPFKSDCFNYVFCNSFHHFDNFEKAFSEIYRVCKKGGRIALGPEPHRYAIDQYFYNTIFWYWNTEKGLLRLTPQKLASLFKSYELRDISFYRRGIDPIGVNPIVEKIFDKLNENLPNFLFFWAHFYITGVK